MATTTATATTRPTDSFDLLTAAEQDIERKRCNAYARCPVNRQVTRLISLLTKLTAEVDELVVMDAAHEITEAWERAGLPPLTIEEREHMRTIADAEHIVQDASGFAWAVRSFLATLESNVVSR